MSIRILKKALGLLVVDIVIIIGIFVLQFRTDSSIIEKIGNLQFTFSQSEDENKVVTVKNKLNVTYNGINFFCDDEHPAVIVDNKNNKIPVKFSSWEKQDDLSYKLLFTNGISVVFELASTDQNASLAIITDFPKNVKNFAIPYSYASNMKIQKDDGNRVILDGRKDSWEVSANSLADGYFSSSKKDFIATYAIYDETQKFTFDSIVELAIANSSIFEQNLAAFRNNLITSFKANNVEANLTEQIVVSYIAAQAESGNYVSAIDEIPMGYKKSKQRTYLSAPYLNTLEEMNAILDKTIKEYEKKITDASNTNSFDIFTVHNIANFMYIHSNPAAVKKLLQGTSYIDVNNLTIAQAAGILQVYSDLVKLNAEYANLLIPTLENCVQRITDACNYDGNILSISENDTFLSVIQGIETGVALLRYGTITNNVTLQKAGYVIVNSYLTESSSFDLRTLANLYPILSFNNWYYPHFEKISDSDDNFIWAWTCAKSITSIKEEESLSIKIDFPENYTHYVILKGIPKFSKIYIYNMAFRTDSRFETYNSSGYVYKQNTKTLLLKSRHKSKIETVTFEYKELNEKVVTDKPVVEIKPANEAVVSTTTDTAAATAGKTDSTSENKEKPTAAEPAASATVTENVAESVTTGEVSENSNAETEPVESTESETESEETKTDNKSNKKSKRRNKKN